MKYCIAICKKSNLQLLDQTIALKSISINNWFKYLPVISKKYSFEFSINGVDRYNGFIIIIDNRLNLAGLDHPDGSILLHQDDIYKLQ